MSETVMDDEEPSTARPVGAIGALRVARVTLRVAAVE